MNRRQHRRERRVEFCDQCARVADTFTRGEALLERSRVRALAAGRAR